MNKLLFEGGSLSPLGCATSKSFFWIVFETEKALKESNNFNYNYKVHGLLINWFVQSQNTYNNIC